MVSQFKNQVSDNLNQRRLIVEEVGRENGEIKYLIVRVERTYENVTQAGTPLNAESLTTIIEDMIRS